MDQHFNNNQNEFLWPLLANPANNAHLYAYNLQRLVNDFPQSGILQALLAHASDEKNLTQASVYFNAKLLYKLINAPSTFIGVPDEKIIIQTNIRTNGHNKKDEQQYAGENSAPGPDENIDNSADDNPVAAVVIAGDRPGTVESGEHEPTTGIYEAPFDEIVSIEQINVEPETNHWIVADEEINDEGPRTVGSRNGALEKLVHGNTGLKYPLRSDTDQRDVSKYNDVQMPYTFMWWLDKTRKEHAGTYQPYIQPVTVNSNNMPERAADELQQQYVENIFHITSIDELDRGGARPVVPFNVKRKEHVIIERFIKEEPQIKPQSSDKLDNENKAKKSSEDRDELVTETLAAIYSDQMLYHKATASYKKLMLKFPEKSRYFAAKIEQLEKKTN